MLCHTIRTTGRHKVYKALAILLKYLLPGWYVGSGISELEINQIVPQ